MTFYNRHFLSFVTLWILFVKLPFINTLSSSPWNRECCTHHSNIHWHLHQVPSTKTMISFMIYVLESHHVPWYYDMFGIWIVYLLDIVHSSAWVEKSYTKLIMLAILIYRYITPNSWKQQWQWWIVAEELIAVVTRNETAYNEQCIKYYTLLAAWRSK